jgi:hypothetical protein
LQGLKIKKYKYLLEKFTKYTVTGSPRCSRVKTAAARGGQNHGQNSSGQNDRFAVG